MPNANNSNANNANRVIIFDTTLRDGEQCPGASMTFEEKLEVADLLDTMGGMSSRRASRSPRTVISNRSPRSHAARRTRSSPVSPAPSPPISPAPARR